jgi:iron complex outermembrane receptor protein
MSARLVLSTFTSMLLAGTAMAQAPEIRLQEVSVEANAPQPQDGAEGVISTDGYVGKSGVAGTKTDTPFLEVPQSISTVTRQQIEDRKPQNLQETLSYVPGVRVGAFGFDPRYDAFTIRGIDVTYTGVFRDGLRQLNSPNGLFRLEPHGLEAVTILKGPAAAIYGASSAGGIVDLISKRPLDRPLREVELQTGSFDRMQGAFDFSGPANASKSVLFRVTGLARDAGTELSAVKDDRVFIAPALTLKPSEDTTITFLSEYMDSTTGGTAAYINTYDGTLSTGATREFGGDARFNDFRQKQGRIGYAFEHRFNDAFTLRQNLRYSKLSTDQKYIFAGYPGITREDTGGISADTNLESRFTTGAAAHTVLTGVDVSHLNYTSWQAFGDFTTTFPPAVPYVAEYEQTQTLVGIYVQDQVELGPWRLLLGGRHDWLSSEFTDATALQYDQKDGRFTGRAGLSYVTAFGLVPYISYGTSFTPNPGTVLNGSVAQPTTGAQVELGVKYDIPGTNAAIRAAVFDLRQENAVVYQVVSGTNVQTQLDLTSRGFELEGTASLANGLNLLASYSYNDVTIDRLSPETVGKTLSSVPFHTFALWADYTFQDGPARGLGLAAGLRYSGSSYGDNLNRPILDNAPRTFVDAAIRYDLGVLDPRLEGARLQVNATNLFDEVKQICSSNYCYWDEGRKVIASLRYRW